MDNKNPNRTDSDILKDFESLFGDIPEPETPEEIETYLVDAGYDIDALKAEGLRLANELIEGNWRFVLPDEIEAATLSINNTPIRTGWKRDRLISAIQHIIDVLHQQRRQTGFAFRNLEELTDSDLASMLQELEYQADNMGIEIDL